MSGVAREAMEDVAPAPGVGEFGVASCGVLLASVVGVIFGPTGLVISSFSLFIEPIAADLDWDRGQSALPVTLLGLAVALSSPLKGWLVDRWGARALVLPLTAALALCLASLALARSGWQLYLLFALLGLLTPGNIPYARILGGWFERRRGAAYGILGLGFGVGGPLALYLGSACIDAFGWRATFLVYGLLEGLLALPLLYALFRERPGDLPQALRPPADALPGATPGQAWRSADFWLIVGNLILGKFNLGFADQPVAHNDGIMNFLGMGIVGWGSVLLGGCPLRQLILTGEGNSDSAVTVTGFVFGAALAHNFGTASSAKGPGANGVAAVIACYAVLLIVTLANVKASKE